MTFNLEKIDLTNVKSLYFLRGYKSEGDDHYCTLMVLRGDEKDEYEVGPFISRKILTIGDGKELLKYLKDKGLKLTSATVLEDDFKRFYNTKAFKKIKLEG